MHNKTKRNDHKRSNKNLRKKWQNFCYTVKNLNEDESIDIFIEHQLKNNLNTTNTKL